MSACVLGVILIEMQVIDENLAFASIQLEHVRLRSLKITREPDSPRPLITRPYRLERGGARKSYFVFSRSFFSAVSDRIGLLWGIGHAKAAKEGYPVVVEWKPE